MLGQCRSKDNGKIHKGGQPVADGILEGLHHRHTLLLNQVPLVDHHHQSLGILLYQREDIQVLALNAAGGIEHQDADISPLNGTDRANDGVVLQILIHLILLTNTGRIYQIEVKAELIVTRIDGVARSTCNVGHDMTILTNQGIHQRRLARIRTSHHSYARNLFLDLLLLLLGEFTQ